MRENQLSHRVVLFVYFCCMYVVVWHANDGMHTNTWMDGWLDDGAGCECKLNANVFVVDWNGERCCDVAAVGVCVCVWWRWLCW